MIFILDACSAINLLHIFKDDNRFLENIFEKYSITFSEKVFEEIDKNLFSNKIFLDHGQKQEIRNTKHCLFKVNPYEDENSQKYLNSNTSYDKLNGEYFSSALALTLSRLEQDHIFFITDDIPAKEEFLEFFEENRVGNIISTSNFLYTLYLLNENSISINESFFNLKREYLIELESFEQNIEKLQNRYKGKKEFYFLDILMTYLKNINIEKLQNIDIETRLPQDIKKISKEIKEYMNQSSANKNILFDEINNYLQLIKEKKYYRL